jgi:hypothetical protein
MWKEIWNTWKYSQVVELVSHKWESIGKDYEDIEEMDVEYSEQLTNVLLSKLLQRI